MTRGAIKAVSEDAIQSEIGREHEAVIRIGRDHMRMSSILCEGGAAARGQSARARARGGLSVGVDIDGRTQRAIGEDREHRETGAGVVSDKRKLACGVDAAMRRAGAC